jgi:Predicted membrane protein
MEHFIRFLKGIIVGMGGVAPGLSGSALLVIFGLYEKTVNVIGTLFKKFKANLLFLIPLFLGFGLGMVIFSKIINYFLTNYESYTRFAFLGLVVGTIPLFYGEVKKKGWNNKYYIPMIISFIVGIFLFLFNKDLFPQVVNPNLIQKVLLGLIVAASTILPGVDSATILSTLGLYEVYLSAVDSFDLSILIPAGIGLGFGALVISYLINKLLKSKYTLTFSIIFGLFISIIPSVLNETCRLYLDFQSIISVFLVIIGFMISYSLGKLNK